MVLHHFSIGTTFRAWVKPFNHQTSVSLLLNSSPGDPCYWKPGFGKEIRCRRRFSWSLKAVNNAIGLFNVAPTDENKNGLDTDKAALQAYRASIKERNESKKFAAGLHQSERATKHFSRAPQHNYLRTPITELKQDNGSVTKDPGKIADGHPRYGGNLFLSTSPDLVSTRTAVYHPLRLAKLLRDTP
ncbi:hypothetical protein PF010_g28295 [Phytophthora fragariae]|uniref:Uncharacterized protein n=1 Tax=Phytophthora fragariae TaxID=53985 RepID=A0A6A3DNV6_9STRA|nr:hypothetical protein PF003_g31480 [Phytophthora fragariae]KAE8884403.1 hypothetical protein PF003_g31479 [Phytophthora fragariae]KAE8920821.1 hypothetical protein PF009_g28891 [Phytophthora fragariae]KAE9065214.1 hypothetical protein PF010_g28295 [Phytophthora fragariae]